MECVNIATPVMASIGTLFSVLALALNKWEHMNSLSGSARMGLWKSCAKDECEDVPDRGALDAVRAMMFLGLFFMLGSIACTLLNNFFIRDNKLIDIITSVVSTMAGLFIMCAIGVYADDIKVHDTDYGSCFALAVISWLLAWGITAIQIYKNNKTPTATLDQWRYNVESQSTTNKVVSNTEQTS